MNAKETLELLSKPWCDVDDLVKLLDIGRTKAFELKKVLRKEIQDQGYFLANNKIPMEYIIKKFNFNLAFLESMAKNNN